MKRMKSMYVRQVAILLGLTFLCMVLLGVGFFSLSYRYPPPGPETPALSPATPPPP